MSNEKMRCDRQREKKIGGEERRNTFVSAARLSASLHFNSDATLNVCRDKMNCDEITQLLMIGMCVDRQRKNLNNKSH